jgi:hypothetical protein
MSRLVATGLLLALLVVSNACEPAAADSVETATPAMALRTGPKPPPGDPLPCMEALATGTIAADPADPDLVWLEVGQDAHRHELGWPWGTTVRFTPDAEIVAPDGRVVAREGAKLQLGGGDVDGVFWVCTIGRQLVGRLAN